MFTPKQERNGTNIGGGDNSSIATPGPMPADVGGLITHAMDATAQVTGDLQPGDSLGAEAHDLMASPAGSGVGGHEIGAHGNMFEWDAGLAITDVEGMGSG